MLQEETTPANTVHVRMLSIVPARTEKVIFVETDRQEDCLILGGEIQKQVYLGNSLSTPTNNRISVMIINASDEDITVKPEHISGRK